MPAPDFRPSPLALAVLCLLDVEPLHPYGIQRLVREWGKDEVINVGQRASLHKMIDRLQRAGLVAVHATERDERYPERTVYAVTEEGRAAAHAWLTEMLTTPRNEFPQFPAALSFLAALTPAETRDLLARREKALDTRLAELDEALAAGERDGLPRVTMTESRYVRAVVAAERDWVAGEIADLDRGDLTWSREQLDADRAGRQPGTG